MFCTFHSTENDHSLPTRQGLLTRQTADTLFREVAPDGPMLVRSGDEREESLRGAFEGSSCADETAEGCMIRINLIVSDNKYPVNRYLETEVSTSTLSSDSVTAQFFTNLPTTSRDSLRAARPLVLRGIVSGARKSRSVIEYLYRARAAEPDVWFRDDLIIAERCVRNAMRNFPHPWNLAFCEYLGKHPSKGIPLLLERAKKFAEMENHVQPEQQSANQHSSSQGDGLRVQEERTGNNQIHSVAARIPSACRTETPQQGLYADCIAELALPPRKPNDSVKTKRRKTA